MKETDINNLIISEKLDTNLISDGYHTFEELYEHRIINYINTCLYLHLLNSGTIKYVDVEFPRLHQVWKSKVHSDGSVWDGWFLLGIDKEAGKQITYHLPIEYWNNVLWAETLNKAPEWDGHTSADVLERLKSL